MSNDRLPMTNQHGKKLASLLPNCVFTGDDISSRYSVDWSAESPCLPSILIKPKDKDQLAQLLSYCNTHGLSIVTQGGLTGLSGGATPQAGEIAVSLERLVGITEVDRQSMTISALAGTPLATIQQAALDAGFRLPLDLGARGSCTIGGNVSTNAGGNQVLSFGMTRALVLGLEVVLANGEIVSSMNKMLKNNAGYDIKQLFIGSEGTLGVVTEVVLRLYPQAVTKYSAWCAFENFNDVCDFLSKMQTQLGRVTAFELMWKNYIDTVLKLHPQMRNPLEQHYPLYVLIEVEGNNAAVDRDHFQQVLAAAMSSGYLKGAVLAQSDSDADEFWSIRDGVTTILTQVEHRANFDVGVPIGSMAAFVLQVEKTLYKNFDNLQLCTFGHMADSNVHFLAWLNDPDKLSADVQKQAVATIYHLVYEIINQFDGTVTAEHGIGTMKKKFLSFCRSEEEIKLMKTLKMALDPNGVLNPNRVIDQS